MATTQTRIELPDNIYRILKDEQQKRRDDSGKKVSLNELVLEYFMAGLQAKLSGLENVVDNSQQPSTNLPAVIMVKEKALELAQKEQLIAQKETSLKYEGEYIRTERSELRDQEQDIREQMQELYEMKDKIAEEKEKIRQMKLEKVEEIVNLKILTADLAKKDEENRHLKEEIKHNKNIVIKLLERIDDNTESSFMKDWIKPLLPTILTIIGYFALNKKIESLKDIKPVIGEVDKMLSSVEPEKKAQMMGEIEKYVKNNRGVVSSPKTLDTGGKIS